MVNSKAECRALLITRRCYSVIVNVVFGVCGPLARVSSRRRRLCFVRGRCQLVEYFLLIYDVVFSGVLYYYYIIHGEMTRTRARNPCVSRAASEHETERQRERNVKKINEFGRSDRNLNYYHSLFIVLI